MIHRIRILALMWRLKIRNKKEQLDSSWQFNCTAEDGCPIPVSDLRFLFRGCICKIHDAAQRKYLF